MGHASCIKRAVDVDARLTPRLLFLARQPWRITRKCSSSSRYADAARALTTTMTTTTMMTTHDAPTRPAARVPHRTDPPFRLSLLAQEEKRKAVFNEVVAKLTDTCFEKCITYAPGSSFSRTESSCLTNCALRYLESGQVVLGRLQNMGGG
jgi:mitochondrial import inner membrane translocase subunit TIM8